MKQKQVCRGYEVVIARLNASKLGCQMSTYRKSFSLPRCCECGAELESRTATYDKTKNTRLYCSACKPIEEIKRAWQPLPTGTSSARVFVIQQKR